MTTEETYILGLTATEQTLVKTLLKRYVNEVKPIDPEDPASVEEAEERIDAVDKIISRIAENETPHSVCTRNVYFNVYATEQQYGGSEEGGWYYTETKCVYTEMVKLPDADLLDANSLSHIANRIFELCNDYDISYSYIDTDEFAECISNLFDEGLLYSPRIGTADRYGFGCYVQMERMPAESQNTATQHYS